MKLERRRITDEQYEKVIKMPRSERSDYIKTEVLPIEVMIAYGFYGLTRIERDKDGIPYIEFFMGESCD